MSADAAWDGDRPVDEHIDLSAVADPGRPLARSAPESSVAEFLSGQGDDDGLREGLLQLSRLSTSGMGLEQLLTRVARYAVRAIPGAEGAGLTLLEDDRPDMVVVTADFVREVDDIQYGIGQGPCIAAAREGQTVLSGSLGGDRRWPRFGGAVALTVAAVAAAVSTAAGLPISPDRAKKEL